jgi:hypothetical protein
LIAGAQHLRNVLGVESQPSLRAAAELDRAELVLMLVHVVDRQGVALRELASRQVLALHRHDIRLLQLDRDQPRELLQVIGV